MLGLGAAGYRLLESRNDRQVSCVKAETTVLVMNWIGNGFDMMFNSIFHLHVSCEDTGISPRSRHS